MELYDRFEEVQTQVEKTQLEFIVVEIDTALTFALSAESLYGEGSTTHANRTLSTAWEAYDEAVKCLKIVLADRALRRHLTAKLDQVRVILDALPKQKPKAPSSLKNGKG